MPSTSLTLQTLRTNLLEYSRWMFFVTRGKRLRYARHHLTICNALTRVITGRTKRLIICLPPRSGKTLLVSQMFTSFGMGLNPASQFILSSYSHTLASDNTFEVREIMRTPEYRSLWSGDTPQLRADSTARERFKTIQGGTVYGVGSLGTITGFGAGGMGSAFAGAIILDDVAKPDEAYSDVMRAKIIRWFTNTLESRKNSPDTPIIVVGQRLHEEDLPGWLMAGGNGEEWEVVNIPALVDGESFWPAQFPVGDLERMQVTKPYVFSGQYQQRPAPEGGGDFQVGNIEIVDAVPVGLYWVRGWDLAATEKKRSDYTASVKMAKDKDGIIYLQGIKNLKAGPDVVEKLIHQTAQVDQCRQSLPQDPGQAGVAQKKNFSKLLEGFDFEITIESGDKRSRAMPFAAQVNAGNVRMLRGENQEVYLAQLEAFPNAVHDDMVDASSRAYNALLNQSTYTLDNL